MSSSGTLSFSLFCLSLLGLLALALNYYIHTAYQMRIDHFGGRQWILWVAGDMRLLTFSFCGSGYCSHMESHLRYYRGITGLICPTQCLVSFWCVGLPVSVLEKKWSQDLVDLLTCLSLWGRFLLGFYVICYPLFVLTGMLFSISVLRCLRCSFGWCPL